MSVVKFPTHVDLMYPTLVALDQLGGSATIQQMEERVPQIAGITDRQMKVVTNYRQIKVFHLMRWARTYLKWVDVIDNPKRGVWRISQEGRRYLRMAPEVAVQRLR